MKEKNNIDELFLKGTERHYPVDEALWAAVESQLPMNNTPKTPWYYSLNSISFLVVILTCSFIPKDNSRTTEFAQVNLNTNSPNLPTTEISEAKENTTSIKTATLATSNSEPEVHQLIEKKSSIQQEKEALETPDYNISKTKIRKQSVNMSFATISSEIKPVNYTTISKGFDNKKPTSINSRKFNTSLMSIPRISDFINMDVQSLTLAPKGSEELKKHPSSKSFYKVELETLFSTAITKSLKNGEQELIDAKTDGESSVEFRSFGLNFIGQKQFFIYGIGIQQAQYSERFAYNIDVEKNRLISSYDTSYSLISGNFNSNGTPVLLIKQKITENQNNETYTTKDIVGGLNTFKWVGLPIFIGVQKTFRNWQVQARFSIIPKYSYHQSGYCLGDNLNSLNTISTKNINTLHFSNRNDLSVGYSFHEQFAIGAKYALNHDLNSFTKEYDTQLKSQLIGVWILWKP